MKYIITLLIASSIALGSEVMTIENGGTVYHYAPVAKLEKSGLSLSQQAQKIQSWLAEIGEPGASNMAAQLFFSLLRRELKRIEKQMEK